MKINNIVYELYDSVRASIWVWHHRCLRLAVVASRFDLHHLWSAQRAVLEFPPNASLWCVNARVNGWESGTSHGSACQQRSDVCWEGMTLPWTAKVFLGVRVCQYKSIYHFAWMIYGEQDVGALLHLCCLPSLTFILFHGVTTWQLRRQVRRTYELWSHLLS